jgi:hypothetical protein
VKYKAIAFVVWFLYTRKVEKEEEETGLLKRWEVRVEKKIINIFIVKFWPWGRHNL